MEIWRKWSVGIAFVQGRLGSKGFTWWWAGLEDFIQGSEYMINGLSIHASFKFIGWRSISLIWFWTSRYIGQIMDIWCKWGVGIAFVQGRLGSKGFTWWWAGLEDFIQGSDYMINGLSIHASFKFIGWRLIRLIWFRTSSYYMKIQWNLM